MNDKRYDEPDPVRWFDALGTCKCGKPAHGKLMGPRCQCMPNSWGNWRKVRDEVELPAGLIEADLIGGGS